MTHHRRIIALAAVLLGTSLACGPCDGSLLDPDPLYIFDGETSLAAGTRSSLRVLRSDDNSLAAVRVHSATSSNLSSLAIESVDGDTLTLIAKEAGSSTLDVSISALGTGEILHKQASASVIEPVDMHLRHCLDYTETRLDSDPVAHLRGYPALVQFYFADADLAVAQGAGLYPIETSSGASLNTASSGEVEMAIDILAAQNDPVQVTTSMVSNPPREDASISLETIAPEAITSIELRSDVATNTVGVPAELDAIAYAGDVVVCSQLPYTIQITTPNVCTFFGPNGQMSSSLIENTRSLPRIKGISSGQCELLLELAIVGLSIAAYKITIQVYDGTLPSGGSYDGGSSGGSSYDFD